MLKKLCCRSSGAASRCSLRKFEITSGSIAVEVRAEISYKRLKSSSFAILLKLRWRTKIGVRELEQLDAAKISPGVTRPWRWIAVPTPAIVTRSFWFEEFFGRCRAEYAEKSRDTNSQRPTCHNWILSTQICAPYLQKRPSRYFHYSNRKADSQSTRWSVRFLCGIS